MDRRRYLTHFMVLLSGTAAAQLANLASYPFLARLYAPEDFGVFAMFIAVSAVPSAIACGRFDLVVPTAPHWGRFAILWLCVTISAGAGMISAIGAALYWWIRGTDMLPTFALLLGSAVFMTGFCAAASLYLMRHERYRTASVSLVVRTGGTVVAQIGLAFAAATSFSLILGFCFGLLLQSFLLAWSIATHVPPRRPRARQMRLLVSRYCRQVSVDIPSTLLAAVALNLMTLLLLILYDERTVGFYALASRIAIVPMQLFNDSLGQVFFQKAAKAQEVRGHFWDEMKFNLVTSGLLSVGVLIMIWLLARPFIEIYLGKEWSPSAAMLVILAPMLAVRSLCMSIATTVFVLRRAHWLFIHNIANTAMILLGFGIALALQLEVYGYLVLSSALLALEYLVFAAFLIQVARRRGTPA